MQAVRDDALQRSTNRDRDVDNRIAELIETHLQVPGFIETTVSLGTPGSSLQESQEQSERKKAPYKVIPDYLKHIETEIK